MSIHLVAGQSSRATPTSSGSHLPTRRPRRYPSDTSDAEWQLIAGFVPAGGEGGRPVTYPRRDIVDAIRYLTHNSCVWRALPVDLPPWRTVYHYFRAWTRDGTLTGLHSALRDQVRSLEGRRPTPTAAIIDSQSVRAADTVPATGSGYDAGKKITGRKRHIAVDTTGLLLAVLITAGNVQDRVAARLLLAGLRTCFPTVTRVWADGGYTGTLIDWARTTLRLTIEIINKITGQIGFQVLPRRWVVERTFAWITRHRRAVRDYERLPEHHAAIVHWAMITVMTRRLTKRRKPPC